LAEIVEPLMQQRAAQCKTFDRYKATRLTDALVNHAIMSLYRKGAINVQRIPEVLEQWEHPAHDWIHGTAWHLFNAVTLSLAGRVAENPASTCILHNVIDGVCEAV
jgi:hypothetical protein